LDELVKIRVLKRRRRDWIIAWGAAKRNPRNLPPREAPCRGAR
jgi:hypothetical protein